ncbi:MAG: hypothetical protein HYR60_13915 [Acidobacteria bacterium]|nr:hypothetical protein [Acidobacteriota bacterium]MBI3473176.1 hypothetical protein [Candidatus Solibacter usitatus]
MDAKRAPSASALAALTGVLAALTCCLPAGALWMAAGLAGVSAIVAPLRPYLLAFAVLAVAFGFWQSHRARRCGLRRSRSSLILLWTAAAVIAASVLIPDRIAAFMAGGESAAAAPSSVQTFDPALFQRTFDAHLDETRIVVLLSPT